jgi:hypothetical protein
MYLEIDEETLERKLREDTPADIREKYEMYLMEKRKNPNVMRPK